MIDREKAVADYFSKIVGTLIGEMSNRKILDEKSAKELIEIIGDGLNEIVDGFKNENFILDDLTKT